MVLTAQEILSNHRNIIIDPFDRNKLNPNSYNLRLHNELLVYTKKLDMKKDNPTKTITIPKDGLWLKPNRLYLGRTIEYTETRGFVPMITGRSSIGRLGMSVHVTAGFGDVGFCGYWTLEIFVIHPLKIYPEVEICQIYYHTKRGKSSSYGGKYQRNTSVEPSKLHTEL